MMDRMMTIPGVNQGRPFEMPRRRVKHRIRLYEKMTELERQHPEEMKNQSYRTTMEGAILAHLIIQDTYPDATLDNILDLTEDIEDPNNLLRLTSLAYDYDYDTLKQQIRQEKTEDFQKGEQPPKK